MPNALVDTGPLVAWFDAQDADHARVREFMVDFKDNLCTTWHVLTEVCHLLPNHTHDPLFRWISEGGLRIFELPPQAVDQIRLLMRKYRDRPMDLADASLVWLANHIGVRAILTLDDGDFRTYRTTDGERFDLLLDMDEPPSSGRAKRNRPRR